MDQYRISNEDYVRQMISTAQKAESGFIKRRQRFLLLTLAACVLCAATVFFALSRSRAEREEHYAALIAGDQNVLTLEILQYKDAYAVYESQSLGNRNAELMTGGFFASEGSIVIEPNENFTSTFISMNNSRESLCGELCSYINLYGDLVYYRNNSDRMVYKKQPIGGEAEVVLEQNVGQFTIADDLLYYIDLENGNALMALNLTEQGEPILLLDNVSSFSIFHNFIMYLNGIKEVRLFSQVDQSDTLLVRNAERFFFNGKLIVQNNRRIIMISLDGLQIERMEFPDFTEVILVDIEDDILYLQNTEMLYSYDTASKKMQKLCEGYNYFAAVHSNKERILALVGDVDRQREIVTREVINMR